MRDFLCGKKTGDIMPQLVPRDTVGWNRRWLKNSEKEDGIDRSYYDKLVDEAVKTISQYGDFEWFVSDDPYIPELGANDADVDCVPWAMPCGDEKISNMLRLSTF